MRNLLIPFGLGMLVCGAAFLRVALRHRDRGELPIVLIHVGVLFALGVLALVSYAFEEPRHYVAWLTAALLGGDLLLRAAYVRFFGGDRDS